MLRKAYLNDEYKLFLLSSDQDFVDVTFAYSDDDKHNNAHKPIIISFDILHALKLKY